jgi:plasmid maintenance system antidote protein VapI
VVRPMTSLSQDAVPPEQRTEAPGVAPRKRPAEVFSPGSVALEEIAARDWDQRDFARRLGWPLGPTRKFLMGARGVSLEMARDLARVFGTGWAFWIRLEYRYRFPRASFEEASGEETVDD